MNVTVFTSKTCSFCRRLKEWLDSNGVIYEEKDVTTNQEYLMELKGHGAKGVPMTIILEESGNLVKISGFNKIELDKFLDVRKEGY